jgi:hypothetical protein
VQSSKIVNLLHQTCSLALKLTLRLLAALSLFAQVVCAVDNVDNDPTVKLLPITPEVEATVAKDLKDFIPEGKATQTGINKNGVYTLSGDIFGNGHIYAIIDSNPLVICEWGKRKWKPILALNTTAFWKSPHWDKDGPGREPIALKPFWMLALQHILLLVITSYVEKAGQNYLVILFDPKMRTIADSATSISSFLDTPVVKDDYLLLMDQSRNKAEWSETYFFTIVRNKLAVQGSWGSYQPFNHPEEGETYFADSSITSYKVTETYGADSHLEGWKVSRLTPDKKSSSWDAEITFVPKARQIDFSDAGLVYLFVDLTGLPRILYPIDNPPQPKEKLEALGTIKVKGNREAVKLLSP